jgi:hypothetical protein
MNPTDFNKLFASLLFPFGKGIEIFMPCKEDMPHPTANVH